ncbi:transcriptional regulator FnrL [Yoonia sp. SS1-5]|uniref:Transcriptional regulator FnrL n=1 Tax=Yoonia rhodophyticola TaxID=3137370 RepID=A0AAN0MFD0_9RHOB
MQQSILKNMACASCPIKHRAVCSRCDADELALLESIKTYKSFSANDQILWRGEELHYVASVVEGVATLGKSLEDGRTQMVGLLLPSDFIGHPGRTHIEFDVVAASDVTLCCFEREPFRKLINDVPHLAQRMVEIALDELDAARDWMVLLGRKTAGEKIATFIEMVTRRQHLDRADGQQTDLVLPLLRSEIANYLGLTLETVSRQLTILKSESVLEFVDKRHFRILDMARLHDATGDDADGGILA